MSKKPSIIVIFIFAMLFLYLGQGTAAKKDENKSKGSQQIVLNANITDTTKAVKDVFSKNNVKLINSSEKGNSTIINGEVGLYPDQTSSLNMFPMRRYQNETINLLYEIRATLKYISENKTKVSLSTYQDNKLTDKREATNFIGETLIPEIKQRLGN
jgi:hypothetical protein